MTRLRASVTACRKCRNNRVYSLIEPDISSSATIGRLFHARPEIFQVDDRAACLHAGAQGAPDVDEMAASIWRETPCAHFVERQRQARDGILGCRNFCRRHLRKIFLLQYFSVGDSQPCVDLDFRLILRTLVESGEQRFLNALRARRRRFRRRLGKVSGIIDAISFSIYPRLRKKIRKAWSNRIVCSCRFTKTACSVQ